MTKRSKSDAEKMPAAKATRDAATVSAPVGTALVTAEPAIEYTPADFQTWARDPEWTLFGGSMLLVSLEPTNLIFRGVSPAVLEDAMPVTVREQFRKIYRRAKSCYRELGCTSRQERLEFPTLYVKQRVFLTWAKAQRFDIPPQLQQSARSRHWIRQDTGARIGQEEMTTPAKIKEEYASRIPEGERILNRLFDDKGKARTATEMDPEPLRVLWGDTLKPYRGRYVKELVHARLKPLCTKPPVRTFAAGESGKAQRWEPMRTQGNRGKSPGNRDDD